MIQRDSWPSAGTLGRCKRRTVPYEELTLYLVPASTGTGTGFPYVAASVTMPGPCHCSLHEGPQCMCQSARLPCVARPGLRGGSKDSRRVMV